MTEPCIIRVRGHLDPDLSRTFGGLVATRSADGSTLLSGSVRDQSELQCHLRRIERFGLSLIEIRVGADRPGREPGGAR